MVDYRELEEESEELCDAFALPIFSGEHELPNAFRAILYLAGLFWLFLGIGIVSDIFMGAIEVITSNQKEILLPDGKKITVKVWNPTIANLSLMALGSSAPEILLNVIEICVLNNFYAGELGPSTIVGSAAFNLLCIIAVCIIGIADGDGRLIKDLNVFYVTAASSIFAYLWLLVILVGFSPNVVQVWEAILTFIFFPCLLIAAFLADKGIFTSSKIDPKGDERLVEVKSPRISGKTGRKASAHEVANMLHVASIQVGQTPKDQDQLARLLAAKILAETKPTRAQLRMNAVRMMVGAKRVVPGQKTQEEAQRLFKKRKSLDGADKFGAPNKTSPENVGPEIQFEAAAYCVLEGDGYCEVLVTRFPAEGQSAVSYHTKPGTATPGEDYEETSGTLVFMKGETKQSIKVKVYDDDECEEDETFSIMLSQPEGARLGACTTTEVTIIDDDEPGELGFRPEDASVNVLESKPHVSINVSRLNGASGQVSCRYSTEDKTARAGRDYVGTEGTLVFAAGEVKKILEIPILNAHQYEKKVHFKLTLSDIVGPRMDMHFSDITECIVSIVNDHEMKTMVDNVTQLLQLNLQKFEVGQGTYASQFKEALEVEGDEDGPTAKDYIMHCITVPWKLLFATIPPTSYGGGWVCFCVSLMYIGGVTVLVGDMASLFGCVIGLSDAVTAITVVALGTSLPDTFASMAAAKIDEYADAAIGNVTGSNSVNVFLGIGLPWSIAAIYWSCQSVVPEKWQNLYGGPNGPGTSLDLYTQYPNGAFAVPAGSLGFSVGIFTCFAAACLILLFIRRKYVGYELGGDKKYKQLSCAFLVFLWSVYVILSALKSYGHI
mmetsp:Transcript_6794/g.8940  ORF Transcript_6794/g.8940 Transcript_6794/m.8940 type:complete len:835 (-) Transcript_6794:299-2803(-)